MKEKYTSPPVLATQSVVRFVVWSALTTVKGRSIAEPRARSMGVAVWQVSLTGTHRDPAHCVPPAQRVPQAPQLALSVVSAASQPLP